MRLKLIGMLFPLLFLVALVPSAQHPIQHALLIGVSEYKNPTIHSLSSSKDISKLKEALSTWGFEDVRIATSPEQTSQAGIKRALESLLKSCKPNEVVYIHFSGHGTRVPDQPELAAHADRLEHCICPYDTDFLSGGAVNPRSVILGSDMGVWLQKFREAGIKNLTLSFDCCHSAGNTRSIGAVARELPNPAADSVSQSNDSREEQHIGLGNFVALYAARASQKAYEEPDRSGGRFSSALAEAIQFEAHSSMSYSMLLQRVNSYLHEHGVGEIGRAHV